MGLSESVEEFLGSSDTRCELDADGNFRVWGLGTADPSAAILVTSATDALKTTDGGRLTGSLDRSLLWQIAGLSLARELVTEPHPKASLAEWIEQLRVAGVDLVAIERSDAL
jgi:hypothetical protein